jgi:hypothetical protein
MSSISLWKWFAGGLVGTAASFFVMATVKHGTEGEPRVQQLLTAQQDTSKTLYGLNGLVKYGKVSLSNKKFIKAIDSTRIDFFRYPGRNKCELRELANGQPFTKIPASFRSSYRYKNNV